MYLVILILSLYSGLLQALELESFPETLTRTEPGQPQSQAPQVPTKPLTEDDIRLNNFKSCVDQAHGVKLQGIALAQQNRFEDSAKLFNIARDAYTTCNDFIPTDLLSYFFLPESFKLAKMDFYADFADLFFQYALIQQDEDNTNQNLEGTIGAMKLALEKLELACEIRNDASCSACRQSYYTVLGDSFRLKKELDQALLMFEKANQFRADDPANLSFWGLTLFEKGLRDEAYQKWNSALAKDPSAPAAEMIREFKKNK